MSDKTELTEDDLHVFHPAATLPTPGVPLILELEDGSRIDGIRPRYVSHRGVDADYRDMKGNRMRVARWAIR